MFNFRPIIDVAPDEGILVYDADLDARFLELKNGELKFSEPCSRRRFYPTTFELTTDSFIKILEALHKLEDLKVYDQTCIICIHKGKIGLFCSDKLLRTPEHEKEFGFHEKQEN